MYLSSIKIENFRIFGSGEKSLQMELNPGLNLIVGENNSGKSAIMDAIRYTLGTTSQEYIRFSENDFYKFGHEEASRARRFSITLKFSSISIDDGACFVEYLTHENGSDYLYVTLTAELAKTKSGLWVIKKIQRRSGKNADGPEIDADLRSNLWCTFLKPLRDAESELIPGRSSRLSQILMSQGELESHKKPILKILNDTEIALEEQQYIINTGENINNDYLSKISLKHYQLKSSIALVGKHNEDDQKLKLLFDKLELFISTTKGQDHRTTHGLGANNLLFIAAELLLLKNNKTSANPLLLVEEPEAHLHPQAQMQLLDFLLEQTKSSDEKVKAKSKHGKETCEMSKEPQNIIENIPQVIMTTHSPNLSSKVPLENITIVIDGKAFSLDKEKTLLDSSDYKFLEKFLDVTKANLFFARGLLIVEGDAENILLPTIAKLIGYPLEKHAVSVINVGHIGLFRYSKIFQRKMDNEINMSIKVACIADRDLRPDLIKEVSGSSAEWCYIEEKEGNKKTFEGHYDSKDAYIAAKKNNDGQNVKTFVSPVWTLEHDLAFGKTEDENLCLEVYQASQLAIKSYNAQNLSKPASLTDDQIITIKSEAEKTYNTWGAYKHEQKAALAYKAFVIQKSSCSKTEAAYWLERMLEDKFSSNPALLIKKLPDYLIEAIKYACNVEDQGQFNQNKEATNATE